MEQKEANDVVTNQPTPEGQAITTDIVFDLFASLVPDSPWATRLKKIKEVFNHLATGCTMLTTIQSWDVGDQVYEVREREGGGWSGPDVIKFSEAVTKIETGLAMLQAKAEPDAAPKADFHPDDDNAIDVTGILRKVGATFNDGQAGDEEVGFYEVPATVQLTESQMHLFLFEYRRQLIEGE